jgi:hypothetical protein
MTILPAADVEMDEREMETANPQENGRYLHFRCFSLKMRF